MANKEIIEYHLNDNEKRTVRELTKEILAGPQHLNDLLSDLACLSDNLPRSIRESMYGFASDETSRAIVFRNTGFDRSTVSKTPKRMPVVPEKRVNKYDIFHLLLSARLGEIFTFDSIQNGTLISDVFPVREDASRAISSGYLTDFSLHTDDAFSDHAGAFLGVRCLRNPDQIPTMISYFDVDQLSARDLANLRSPVYSISANIAHKLKYAPPRRAVLFGAKDAPYFRVNLNTHATQECSTSERRSYERFAAVLERNKQLVTLTAGDCIYIDNYRAAHGRKIYSPRLDGTDRWYRRVYISKDLRASRSLRDSPTSRIIRNREP
jgi:hypothetical protein